MIKKLHIDIETYSSVDIKTSGSYKYMESLDFEILMVAFAFDEGPIQIIDLALGEKLPRKFIKNLTDPKVEKHAHNANFERNAFRTYGYDVPIKQWKCTAIKAAYCGLPLSLKMVSKALELEDRGKSSTGESLIRFFCSPIKATKANDHRVRNFPKHDMEKWEEFKQYCVQDVEAERTIDNILMNYRLPLFEKRNYMLDQKINDTGLLTDLDFARKAYVMNDKFSTQLMIEFKELTGLENPNSPAQLKKWLSDLMQKEVTTLAKDGLDALIEESELDIVRKAIGYRKKLSKSSVKKYVSMMNCACEDERVRGLFQFYGANRTGRWSGRLVQLQNLPRNYLKDLDEARRLVASGDYDLAMMLYNNIANILSELIRTAFVPKPNHTFVVADFSAIEARVISWLAGEKWRIEVFESHGKIYEASASMMFNVPIEKITKGSDLRQKGKTAELALGYQGSIGAMKAMDRDNKLTDPEMRIIVKKWRKANPNIVKLWWNLNECAIAAVKKRTKIVSKYKNLEFEYDGTALTIKLPSGKKLFYWEPKIQKNKYNNEALVYRGVDQKTAQWVYVDTYGGKLAENIVQAISRDLLAHSMLELDKEGFNIVMHVHDEAIAEQPIEGSKQSLEKMCKIMSKDVPWAEGLPLGADGYVTPYYKKD